MCPKQWHGCQCLRFLLLILMWIEILLLYYLRMQLHRVWKQHTVCKRHKCTNCTWCANTTSVPIAQGVQTPQVYHNKFLRLRFCAHHKLAKRTFLAAPESRIFVSSTPNLTVRHSANWAVSSLGRVCSAKYSLSKAQVKHMIEHDHQMDWGPLLCARLCTSPEICSVKLSADSAKILRMRL